MNTYVAIYKGKLIEVNADSSYQAQLIAAKEFKVKHSYDVTAYLVAIESKPVIHSTSSI